MAQYSILKNDIVIREATILDIPSMQTIVPRAFHPVNDHFRRCVPDTPLIRDWWARIFRDQIESTVCRLLVASQPQSSTVLGLLVLKQNGASETGSMWDGYGWTADHDQQKCQDMIAAGTQHNDKLTGGRRHYSIELLGVDHSLKGSGAGSALVAKACRFADEDRLDAVVEANATAAPFYERYGFETKLRVVMPDTDGYTEYLMLRPCRQANG